MAGNNGNSGNDMQDIYVDGVKALYPDFGDKPLFNSNGGGSRNPGVRLIDNSDKMNEMLKMLWFPEMEMARNVNDALAECDEFLFSLEDKEHKKPNLEVMQRIEWVKNLCACLCSVNARFADIYKQTSIGVATTAVTEKGSTLLSFPANIPGAKDEPKNNSNGRKP